MRLSFGHLNLLWAEITGVMCNLTTPLKAAGIPVYAVSTWLVISGEAVSVANDIVPQEH